MNAPEASQIVYDDHDEALTEDLAKRLALLALQLPPVPKRVSAKLWIGQAVHPLGIHTFVRHKRYDADSKKLVDVGRVCMFCTRGYST